MQYLLDTHTFIWFIEDDKRLYEKAAAEIENIDNECYISIASLWEISIKSSLGKLMLKSGFQNISSFLVDNNIDVLAIEFRHLTTLLNFYFIHRDPFDRLIVAQGIADNLTIVSLDQQVLKYPVKCLW